MPVDEADSTSFIKQNPVEKSDLAIDQKEKNTKWPHEQNTSYYPFSRKYSGEKNYATEN